MPPPAAPPREPPGPPPTLGRHLGLLLRLRLLLKARDIRGTFFELLIPAALILLLVSIAQISEVLRIPANNYDAIPRYPNHSVAEATAQVLTDLTMGAAYRAFDVGGLPIPIFPADLRPCDVTIGQRLGRLAFAPRGRAEPLVHRLLATPWTNRWFSRCRGHPLIFDTEEDAVKWTHNDDNAQDLWALIVVQEADNVTQQYTYKIRTRSSVLVQTPYLGLAVEPYALGRGRSPAAYFRAGFTQLQHLLGTMVYCEARPDVCANIKMKPFVEAELSAITLPFPVEDVSLNLFFQAATGFVPLVFVIAFIYPLSRLVKGLVEEREQRLRELLLMMGLHPAAYPLAWLALAQAQAILSSVLVTLCVMLLFSRSGFPLLFAVVFLHCTASVATCFFIAALFNRARTAVLGAVLLLFASEMPFLLLTQHQTFRIKLVLSLLPNMAFSYAMRHIGQAEAANTSPSIDDGDFTILHSLGFLAADIVLYHFLAWYVAQVHPGEFGLPRSPWFLFTPAYWLEGTRHHSAPLGDPASPPPDVDDDPLIEPVAAAQKPLERVWVRHLRKVFPGHCVAVEDLSLGLYEDTITVLLGHNGAGKTTTINMLTGMLPPTSGDGRIFGRSLRHEVPAIRRDLGVCPQQNVLWPTLTVREHLAFFARLKRGTSVSAVAQEVDEMIASINLSDKAHVYSSALSGGMKRRLCLGIALVGGSRLVFLDEPTAGMDPEAREQAHRLLLSHTRGRVMVLSTHFMDEADKLGDRIAIMSRGAVRCCGSPLFLKARLGVGYHLTVSPSGDAATADPRDLVALVHSHVPSAVCKSVAAMELAFQLTFDTAANFGPLFRELETWQADGRVSAVGIAMTRLEDVYLRIALEDETRSAAEDAEDSSFLEGNPGESFGDKDEFLGDTGEAPDLSADDAVDLIRDRRRLLPLQFYGLVLKRFHVARRDRWFQFCLIVLPVAVVIGALLLTEIALPNPDLTYTPEQYPAMLKKPTEIVVADLEHKFPWEPRYQGVSYFPLTNESARTSLATTQWLSATLRSHPVSRYGAFVIGDTIAHAKDGPVLMDTVMHNSTAFHALPTFYAELLQLKLRRLLDAPALRLTFIGQPFPMPARLEAAFNTLKLVGAAIIILFPFTFIPANFASFLVKERSCKAKHVQVVSGVNLVVFWLANYCWDMLQFSVTVFLTMATFAAFGKQEYIGTWPTALATLSLFLLYGTASTALAYLCHFPFTSHTASQTLLMLANLIAGVVLVIAAQVMGQIESTKHTNAALLPFYRLLPAYCLGEGLLNLSFPPEFYTYVLHIEVSGPFDLRVAGRALLYLALETPVFLALTLLCEYAPGRRRIWKALTNRRGSAEPSGPPDDPAPGDGEDADVRREREVERGDGRPSDLVTVQHLGMEYPAQGQGPPVKAVRDLSFGVHEGEIFALLGVNGAGKTTTLSILSGEFEMTAGRALLNHYDISTDLQAARQGLGYCPQFDALLDLMTVEEHLALYCRLRGIPPASTRACVTRAMRHLGLMPYARRVARALSGGTRRKLSMAIALIGGPRVVFLDEPSAGMDPIARRSMCDAIAAAARGRAIILTTHHLEEVEALAHRVGIMVAGQFRCLGSLAHLKAKFGHGYWLEFRVPDGGKDAVIDYVRRSFGKALVEESSPGFLKLKALQPALRLSAIFEGIEANREALQLMDYSVSQPTLEQVFLSISDLEAAARIRSDSAPQSRADSPRS